MPSVTLGVYARPGESQTSQETNTPSATLGVYLRICRVQHSVYSPGVSQPSSATFFSPSALVTECDTRRILFVECPVDAKCLARGCRMHVYRVLYAECYTRQTICRVFFALRRVPVALGISP